MSLVDMTCGCQELQYLLEKIYRDRGFDFRLYRESTLIRRLGRRLYDRGVKTYADYAKTLDHDPDEYGKLFDDLTINVTCFFRDKTTFLALEKEVFPALITDNRKLPNIIRIWCAGCSTGEEPYSIAIFLLESLGKNISAENISILATDIDTKALDRAREGWFSKKNVDGVRPDWLEKYFIPEKEGFLVKPVLRRSVVFDVHNVIDIPPCRDIDFVLCRNVLIYFRSLLQAQVQKNIHEGLKTGGFLLLGKAETIVGESRKLFVCVDHKAKLYRKV